MAVTQLRQNGYLENVSHREYLTRQTPLLSKDLSSPKSIMPCELCALNDHSSDLPWGGWSDASVARLGVSISIYLRQTKKSCVYTLLLASHDTGAQHRHSPVVATAARYTADSNVQLATSTQLSAACRHKAFTKQCERTNLSTLVTICVIERRPLPLAILCNLHARTKYTGRTLQQPKHHARQTGPDLTLTTLKVVGLRGRGFLKPNMSTKLLRTSC